jgi:hypothetical protein
MRRAALEHGDLVAQRRDLGLLGGAGLKCRGKQSEQGNEDRAHCENDDDLTNDLTSVFPTGTGFSATTRGKEPTQGPASKQWQSIAITADLFGSSGRTRTYNPSVNSRMLYH